MRKLIMLLTCLTLQENPHSFHFELRCQLRVSSLNTHSSHFQNCFLLEFMRMQKHLPHTISSEHLYINDVMSKSPLFTLPSKCRIKHLTFSLKIGTNDSNIFGLNALFNGFRCSFQESTRKVLCAFLITFVINLFVSKRAHLFWSG